MLIQYITIFNESVFCSMLGLEFAVSVYICVLQTPDLQTTDWVQVCLSVQCIYTVCCVASSHQQSTSPPDILLSTDGDTCETVLS